ncbi:MAG: adenine nucleotide alpha hydrolase [Planctomycetota bacterium]|nr:adenine nucleotide alpha hydrolase [Planctomycetota bacterium]
MPTPILVSSSAGKDSTLALHELQRAGTYTFEALLCTVTAGYDVISLHGVRTELLRRHADALGIPLHAIEIPPNCTNAVYDARMTEALLPYRERGVRAVSFGDLYLTEIRAYREHNLATLGMQGIFPLWGRDTAELARTFVELGFEAVVTCIDTQQLDPAFLGRRFDEAFLRDLPREVDSCGENGEFHSFVHAGPNLREPVRFTLGHVEKRGRFVFQDLIPS